MSLQILFSVSGQLSTTVSERAPWGAQGICQFSCVVLSVSWQLSTTVSDLALTGAQVVTFFLFLSVTSLECLFFSVSGQLSTTVSERAPWGAQRVTFFFSISFSHFTWILIFSLWAFVHHSLWGFDGYASLSSRLSGSPWKGYALPSTMFRSFDLCPSL